MLIESNASLTNTLRAAKSACEFFGHAKLAEAFSSALLLDGRFEQLMEFSKGQYQLIRELVQKLEESNKDLVVTIGHIGGQVRASTDPNAASRWEGVIEQLQNQIDANRKVIAHARGEDGE